MWPTGAVRVREFEERDPPSLRNADETGLGAGSRSGCVDGAIAAFTKPGSARTHWQRCARAEPHAAQESSVATGAFAGALNADQANGAPPQAIIAHRRGGPGSPLPSSRERSTFTRFDALAEIRLEERPGKRRQAADMVVQPLRGLGPVDAGVVVRELVRIGHALGGCGVKRGAAGQGGQARTMRSAPRTISLSCSSPAFISGVMATRSTMATGPVSSPLLHLHDGDARLRIALP